MGRHLLDRAGTGANLTPPCGGFVKRNFNQRIQSGNDASLTAGHNVSLQWLQHDLTDPAGFGDGLTNALRFTITP